jgi:uncharacterized membrane protein
MAHIHDTDKHPRQEFQVERLAFFSDAVFAIAITLLIIEFKIPHVTPKSTYEEVLHELGELKLHLLALLLSFFFIGVYWVRHHALFKYIHNYNRQIVVANMVSLLPIIFLPFTTSFFAECAVSQQTVMLGIQAFFINHFVACASLFALYWLAIVRHSHCSFEMPLPERLKFYEETLFMSIIFIAMFIASVLTKNINIIMGVLVAGVGLRTVAMRRVRKKIARVPA